MPSETTTMQDEPLKTILQSRLPKPQRLLLETMYRLSKNAGETGFASVSTADLSAKHERSETKIRRLLAYFWKEGFIESAEWVADQWLIGPEVTYRLNLERIHEFRKETSAFGVKTGWRAKRRQRKKLLAGKS